jgi:hypothetical protein
MSFNLHSVVNGTTPENEYVWLQVTEELNIKGYALIDRTFDSDNILSNEFRHIFVFPSLKIGKNDWVRLYTCNGTYSRQKVDGKENFIHNFYWGSTHCIWNNNGQDIATLLKYEKVKSVKVPVPQ